MIKNVCIFASSCNFLEEIYYKDAKKLGKLLAENGFDVVYGGSCLGLMWACAGEVKENGGKLTGVMPEKLKIVEKGEKILKSHGFECCRLRLHENIARIEISQEKFNEFLNKKDEIVTKLKNLEISYITLDLEGLRSGSMDVF